MWLNFSFCGLRNDRLTDWLMIDSFSLRMKLVWHFEHRLLTGHFISSPSILLASPSRASPVMLQVQSWPCYSSLLFHVCRVDFRAFILSFNPFHSLATTCLFNLITTWYFLCSFKLNSAFTHHRVLTTLPALCNLILRVAFWARCCGVPFWTWGNQGLRKVVVVMQLWW